MDSLLLFSTAVALSKFAGFLQLFPAFRRVFQPPVPRAGGAICKGTPLCQTRVFHCPAMGSYSPVRQWFTAAVPDGRRGSRAPPGPPAGPQDRKSVV